jgi:hypothetical protein
VNRTCLELRGEIRREGKKVGGNKRRSAARVQREALEGHWGRGSARVRRVRRRPPDQCPTSNTRWAALTPSPRFFFETLRSPSGSRESSRRKGKSELLQVPRIAQDPAAGNDPQPWNLSPASARNVPQLLRAPGVRRSVWDAWLSTLRAALWWLRNARPLGTAPLLPQASPRPQPPRKPCPAPPLPPSRTAGEKGTCKGKKPKSLGFPFSPCHTLVMCVAHISPQGVAWVGCLYSVL